jgi:uncharacterized protein (TIGR02246 family)
MNATTSIVTAVLGVLDAFAAGYARHDEQSVIALYATDADMVAFVGGSKHQGPQQIRAMVESDLAGFDNILWCFATPIISAAGAAAWLTASATVTGQTEGNRVPLGLYHLTWVLEQRREQWFIVHAHLSAATM